MNAADFERYVTYYRTIMLCRPLTASEDDDYQSILAEAEAIAARIREGCALFVKARR